MKQRPLQIVVVVYCNVLVAEIAQLFDIGCKVACVAEVAADNMLVDSAAIVLGSIDLGTEMMVVVVVDSPNFAEHIVIEFAAALFVLWRQMSRQPDMNPTHFVALGFHSTHLFLSQQTACMNPRHFVVLGFQ